MLSGSQVNTLSGTVNQGLLALTVPRQRAGPLLYTRSIDSGGVSPLTNGGKITGLATRYGGSSTTVVCMPTVSTDSASSRRTSSIRIGVSSARSAGTSSNPTSI